MSVEATCEHARTLSAGTPTPGSKQIATVLACALVCVLSLACAAAPAGARAAGGAPPGAGTPGAAAPVASSAVRACTGADVRPTATNTRAVDAATLCLMDVIRAAYHLRALHPNHELDRVAASQVSTMVHNDYFADDRPGGQTPMSLIGVTAYIAHASAVAVGQNIAWGTAADSTARHIVAEWMASPPHRAVILTGEYRDAGVAVTPALPSVLDQGPRGATYAVELADRRY